MSSVELFPDQQVLDKAKLSLSKQLILDSSKLHEFADDNFRFDGNDDKFSRRVGTEIACCDQFRICSGSKKVVTITFAE